ncbi:MAG: hypothetical protein ACFE95_23440 [Candidatus Hodarchaeota archaeon]
MKTNNIILALILTVPFIPWNQSSLAVASNWLETFDSSDALDSWWTTYGTWIIEEGHLISAECEFVSEYEGCKTSLWYNQTQTTGTWTFDILTTGNETFGSLFYFMGFGVVSNPVDFHPTDGYAIYVSNTDRISLDYASGGFYQYSIDKYTLENPLNDWAHFVISRNQTGFMMVFLNNELILSGSHTTVTYSEVINIQSETGVMFDNIGYNEEILTETTTTTTTTTMAEPGPGFEYSVLIFCITVFFITRKWKRRH